MQVFRRKIEYIQLMERKFRSKRNCILLAPFHASNDLTYVTSIVHQTNAV